jgi:hypothetical protein
MGLPSLSRESQSPKGETKRIFKTTLPREGDLEHNALHNFGPNLVDYLEPLTQGRVFPPRGRPKRSQSIISPRESFSPQGRVRYGVLRKKRKKKGLYGITP